MMDPTRVICMLRHRGNVVLCFSMVLLFCARTSSMASILVCWQRSILPKRCVGGEVMEKASDMSPTDIANTGAME
jgi:hypothetical protein